MIGSECLHAFVFLFKLKNIIQGSLGCKKIGFNSDN